VWEWGKGHQVHSCFATQVIAAIQNMLLIYAWDTLEKLLGWLVKLNISPFLDEGRNG